MSKGMIKVFLFYQRLARKEKLLLLLAGSQALCKSQEWSLQSLPAAAAGEALSGPGRSIPEHRGSDPAPTLTPLPSPATGARGGKLAAKPGFLAT